MVHNPSIPQQTSIISTLHSLHPILHNVKSGVLFIYTWNKPSNELEFHRLTPRLCLQGRPSSVADLRQLKIHSDGPSQNLQRSKYIISGRRGFCSARNTLFLAVAELQQLKIHSDGPSQICNNPSLCLTAPPHRITLCWPPFP